MKIKDGDVEAWLDRISWSTLKGWLDFMAEEPIGEERDDLRIGALASVFLNMKIDTEAVGGLLKPRDYISGWGDDREYVLAIKPPEMDSEGGDTKHDEPLSNPIAFDNFITNLAHGREIQRS